MEFLIFIGPPTLLAVIAIVVRERGMRGAYIASKPLPILWIIGYVLAALLGKTAAPPLQWWVLAGLISGVLGDFFLSLNVPGRAGPGPYFRWGFLFFALGHVCYAIGFLHADRVFGWLFFVLLWSCAAVFAISWIRAMPARHARRRVLVGSYLVLLTLLISSGTNAGQNSGAPYTLAFGVLLFAISDVLWSYSRFLADAPDEADQRMGGANDAATRNDPMSAGELRPIYRSGAWILGTYYLGQALIAWGTICYG